jgi:hypothetical protein
MDDGANGDVNNVVNYDELQGIYYARSLTVTDFPASSLGKRFRFIVKVYTDYTDANGIESVVSNSIILADLPDQPSTAPTRNVDTDELIVAVNILTVAGDHGSPITSYNIEIDDGNGGEFRELQG